MAADVVVGEIVEPEQDSGNTQPTVKVKFKGVDLTVYKPTEGMSVALMSLQRQDVSVERKLRIINMFLDNWMADEASQDAMMGLLTQPAVRAIEEVGALMTQVTEHFKSVEGNRAERRAAKRAPAKKVTAKKAAAPRRRA